MRKLLVLFLILFLVGVCNAIDTYVKAIPTQFDLIMRDCVSYWPMNNDADSTIVTDEKGYAQGTLNSLTGSALHEGTAKNFFSGSIDDVGIYDRVLTQAEITYLFELGN